MAEPTNTPMPPGTPVSWTPRSASPAPPPLPNFSSHLAPGTLTPTSSHKPVVLHIGDPIKYNPETYAEFSALFDVVRPEADERQRPEFIRALKERRWGNFAAIFRPFWGTGGEMGKWDAELIDLLPSSVRVFASAGAGFDWADTKLLGERGIIYCNSGLAAAEAVADFAIAMIISTFRALPYCLASNASPAAFRECHARATGLSHNLRGHALALIGLGNIGQQIAYRCRAAFGMEISYYDIERKPPAVESRVGARFCDSLEQLLRGADCVVLCTPAAGGGKALMDARTLGWFKPGSRFVNIARGSLVDEEALADALEQPGRLAAAALDVHADEPNVSPRLLALAGTKALLSCHNAGGTVETHVGFEELSMRNIMAVLGGGDAITPVNMHWLAPPPQKVWGE